MIKGRTGGLTAAVAAGVLVLVGCSTGPLDGPAPPGNATGATSQPAPNGTASGQSTSPSPTPTAVAKVTAVPAANAKSVRPDRPVVLSVAQGRWTTVRVTNSEGAQVEGALNKAGTVWTSSKRLTPDESYKVAAAAVGTDNRVVNYASKFSTLDPKGDLKASISPLDGMTVGVGMPVMIYWNYPVQNKAAVERALKVTTSKPVEGSWSWFGDEEVHWRPKSYWPSGVKVSVDVDIRGLDAGNGIWGSAGRDISFEIGRSVISYIDVARFRMVVKIGGEIARTVPVTAGKEGFTTRSGIKVIMEKYETKRMDARTTGIQPGDPEYYNIRDVRWAQRVTNSGEFIHGAPWSSGSQGSENVSHGCVGMSLANAVWYFGQTQIGDPVIVTGSSRQLTPSAGAWYDWNISWSKYQAGSALH